jgi:hypothetical protein
MNNKANDTIDEVTRFLELVNKHLKEKNCKHTSCKRVCKFKRVAINRKNDYNNFLF